MNDLWQFDLITNRWTYLSGNQSVHSEANYDMPYPGGVEGHAIALDLTDQYLYVFGGNGYDSSNYGIGYIGYL